MVVAMAEQVLGVQLHMQEMEPLVVRQAGAVEVLVLTVALLQEMVEQAQSESIVGR